MTDKYDVLALLHNIVAENRQYTTWTVSTPHLMMLWEKAQDLEREACIDLVAMHGGSVDLEAAIRARGQA